MFISNVNRLRSVVKPMLDLQGEMKSILSWENKRKTIIAFAGYLLTVWFFELYMVPLGLLGLFLKYFLINQWTGGAGAGSGTGAAAAALYAREPRDTDDPINYNVEDVAEEEEEPYEDPNNPVAKDTASQGVFTKIRAAQEQLRVVQNIMGFAADSIEQLQNTFNFTTQWLSCMAVALLAVGTIVLYLVPLRLLLLAYGINKFTKRLRKPKSVGNNELLDFLSRVPTNEQLEQYKLLRPRDVPSGADGVVTAVPDSVDGETAPRSASRQVSRR